MLEHLPIAASPLTTPGLAVRLDRPLQGEGDVAVLYLHGFGSQQDGEKANFFRQQALAAGLAFCSFDFQGHGASGGSLFDVTLSRNLADIEQVHRYVADQGFPRVVLFGSSMGGASALWYAARHPDTVAAAVHIAPALGMAEGLRQLAGPEGMAQWKEEGRFALATELVRCDVGWSLVEDLERYPNEDLYRRYRTPTLLFQGRHDTSVDWRTVVRFAVDCRFEGIEVHLIADGDHRLISSLAHLWSMACSFLRVRGVWPGATPIPA